MMRWSRGFFPSFGGGTTRFQPVYVGDVADAVSVALANSKCRGRIYELGGPSEFTLQQILELIAQLTGRKFIYVPVPFFMLSIAGVLLGWLPFAPITYDQVKLLRKDNVVKGGPDAGTVETLAELGISPTSVEAVVPSYLVVYRPTGQYFERESVWAQPSREDVFLREQVAQHERADEDPVPGKHAKSVVSNERQEHARHVVGADEGDHEPDPEHEEIRRVQFMPVLVERVG